LISNRDIIKNVKHTQVYRKYTRETQLEREKRKRKS